MNHFREVTAHSSARHLARVSNGFYIGLSGTEMHYRSTLYFQPKPTQLCFVLSMNALVYKAVQKPEPMTRNYWSNTRICGQHRGRTVLSLTDSTTWIIHNLQGKESSIPSLQMPCGTRPGSSQRLPLVSEFPSFM